MPIYNKLVRDRIPEVIQANGKTCRTRTLDNEEYIEQLNTKLNEEMLEYLHASDPASSLEELADMIEVIRVIVKAKGFSWEVLEQVRKEKEAKRGAFDKRVYLIDVED